METKTAIVIGATGLVGNELVQQLLKDSRFENVIVFARRHTGLHHQKLKEHIIDFDKKENWEPMVKGDVLFSALGTTIKEAGSKEEQHKIDYKYQYDFAKAAANNGVPVYALVSAAGADANSPVFYTKLKGELEEGVKKLKFNSAYLLQPSLLVGDRKKRRTGELFGFVFLNMANKFGFLKKYSPIPAPTVAKAMINSSFIAQKGTHTIAVDKIVEVAKI